MAPKDGQRVLIVAGEASGDQRAARLVAEVRKRAPQVAFTGIGGERMREAGVETVIDAREMAVVGLFEVLRHFPRLYGALQEMRRRLREQRPDLLILVDYPDFNLRLARTAKAEGIPVLYYISPQVWAWRSHRVHEIGERVDQMAVVFPFEVPFYQKAGVPARFVGHPLVDEVTDEVSREEARSRLGLPADATFVGLLPGSRRSEVQRLLPPLLEAAERLQETRPGVRFLLPRAGSLSEAELAPHLARTELDIEVIPDRFYDTVRACDAVATASGTATLEVALLRVPLVVVYKVSALSFAIMRRMVRLEHIALCNIVAGEEVAPELLQQEARPERIAEELSRLLEPERAAAVRESLRNIRGRLGGSGGSANAAALVLEMLGRASG